MTSEQIRKLFLEFFKKRGHNIIPSASLIPENDPSVLFTTAGMQPLVPYLLGQPHPLGKRVANVQKSVRTQDIEEIGDNTHLSFFEMMGNWSFGDYFKKEAILWSYELLTSEKEGFGLEPSRLYVTVFEGDENVPKDNESYEVWKSLGIPENRIYFMSAKSNWWSAGDNGPSGPDTEMFYDITPGGLNLKSKEEFIEADKGQKVVEIWNNVFMEYEMKDGVVIGKLSQKNVDTGSGLERVAMVLQKKDNVFDTDLFSPIIVKIKKLSNSDDIRAQRIIADHIRTAVFLISDRTTPSNTGRGYVLRKLLRRARYHLNSIGGRDSTLASLVPDVISLYKQTEYELGNKRENIENIIKAEENQFNEVIESGKSKIEKIIKEKNGISGEDAFVLFSTFGFPLELTKEIAKENSVEVDVVGFIEKLADHQKLSRTSSTGMFKGGLANHNEKTIKLHTAHHLLLAALQEKFGAEIKQKGSNITEERLRMDFSFNRKITQEEVGEIEGLVNKYIKNNYTVVRREMPRIEAEKLGAQMEFGAKYPDIVSVYFIEDENGKIISKEFCGGPHAEKTGVLGNFKILKEESVSAGIRRIKAVLQ
ncbi:MAG: alanine--tRNA ligase [Candidatus Zambryskibacteria bacterium CG_4_9_14_3_um_filter_40_16]|uniref:Alanine--tRNA ligase n=2 Tax=Candidatus Zambryskiibacteriota TaxID=1817925 RepID=A0A2H0K6I1_9BACT|nr:MAG: alanine--tRNA ligase [Candidatus Zambryskibacteria bacterium CG11_big_fil_rev_8_21_14_0_20_40_24]PJA33518.1 MAG: alanine--tRNA ligase [Candidatus Zambryskibacteria bacterium CG_4_9_14_3_um_filter_40_16]